MSEDDIKFVPDRVLAEADLRPRILPPTGPEFFEHGETLLFAGETLLFAAARDAHAFEDWVDGLRVCCAMDSAGRDAPPIDWNYSGGAARLLYIGGPVERERVVQAVWATLPHRGVELILRWTGDEAAVMVAIEPEPFVHERVEMCTECNSTNTSTIVIRGGGYRGLEHTCLHCGHTWSGPG